MAQSMRRLNYTERGRSRIVLGSGAEDGVDLVRPIATSDFKMRIFNMHNVTLDCTASAKSIVSNNIGLAFIDQ